METFERIHRTFFASDGLNSQQKNHTLIKELRVLQDRPDNKIAEELYRTVSTFGVLGSTNHDRLRDFDRRRADQHAMVSRENGYSKVALVRYQAIFVGHALFNYSLPEPDKDLLMLYYQILETKYFNDLGFDLKYTANNKPIKNAILEAIHFISVS